LNFFFPTEKGQQVYVSYGSSEYWACILELRRNKKERIKEDRRLQLQLQLKIKKEKVSMERSHQELDSLWKNNSDDSDNDSNHSVCLPEENMGTLHDAGLQSRDEQVGRDVWGEAPRARHGDMAVNPVGASKKRPIMDWKLLGDYCLILNESIWECESSQRRCDDVQETFSKLQKSVNSVNLVDDSNMSSPTVDDDTVELLRTVSSRQRETLQSWRTQLSRELSTLKSERASVQRAVEALAKIVHQHGPNDGEFSFTFQEI
jgi:hypothetical protein